jgi:hypothetical protein
MSVEERSWRAGEQGDFERKWIGAVRGSGSDLIRVWLGDHVSDGGAQRAASRDG